MYRTEYPEPQFQREHWMNLNGAWQFAFDDQDLGIKEGWYQQHDFEKKIEVPFVYQTELVVLMIKVNMVSFGINVISLLKRQKILDNFTFWRC